MLQYAVHPARPRSYWLQWPIPDRPTELLRQQHYNYDQCAVYREYLAGPALYYTFRADIITYVSRAIAPYAGGIVSRHHILSLEQWSADTFNGECLLCNPGYTKGDRNG
jgi:hypothetical protein